MAGHRADKRKGSLDYAQGILLHGELSTVLFSRETSRLERGCVHKSYDA